MTVAAVEPMRTAALWEHVAAALRRAIVLGELAPGVHLKEPLLAERFGVSRLPVREAISRLEHEGLVRVEPRKGAFVVGITERGIADLYECRLLLESHAVRRMAAHIDAAGVAGLQVLVDHMEAAVAADRLQDMAAADMAFHRRLIVLSANRALLSAWEPLAPLIETILIISDTAYANPVSAVGGHKNIIRALSEHDAGAAMILLREHLANAERVVHEALTPDGDQDGIVGT